MDRRNNKIYNIKSYFGLFIKENLFDYIVLIIMNLVAELGVIYSVYRLNNFLQSGFMQEGRSRDVITLISIVLVVAVCKIIKAHYDFKLSNEGLIYIEKKQLDHVMHSKYESTSMIDKIELAQQINNDCVTISDFYVAKLLSLIVNIIKLIVILYLIAKSSLISSVILLALIVFYVIIFLLSKKIYKKKNLDMLEAQQKYFSVLGGELLNIFLVKANSWYKETIKRFEQTGSEFVKKSIKFLDFDFIISNFIQIVSMIVLILFPVLMIITGVDISLIFVVVLLSQMFFDSFNQTFNIMRDINQKNVSLERQNKLLRIERDQNGDKCLEKINNIHLKDVSFKYQQAKNYILENKTFNFEKDKVTLIKGDNGSGKSTIIKLILSILYAQNGEILIDDQAMSEINMESLKKDNIAFCEQEPYLVKGTILENLNYGLDNAKDLSFYMNNPLLSFVKELPNGFDTEITQSNNNISGGQKQRIGIVRALSKESANVYIFDEPTSALDVKSIEILTTMIKEKKKGNIIIVITHDKDFEKVADKIYSL